MIKIFEIASAESKTSPSYDAIVAIRRTPGALAVPGLPTTAGPNSELILKRAGSKWTDCLTPTLSHLPLIWSQRVVEAIMQEGCTGLRCTEVDIRLPNKSKLPPQPGKYYQIAPLGAAPSFKYKAYIRRADKYEFLFETMDEQDLNFRGRSDYVYRRQILLENTLDGSDFMQADAFQSNLLVFGGFYVSRKVVELAKRQKWTNFNLTPIDHLSVCSGDFLERPWPPELWYPENHPKD